ncbi:hypothetical protein COXBURSA331_A0117 [Coxiella burnetii RSA 331]|nr:hypothetical protein COXBURSA331_A0117 [Coxiella burnetii RSA 331]
MLFIAYSRFTAREAKFMQKPRKILQDDAFPFMISSSQLKGDR